MLTQPRKTVLRTRRRLAPPARERLMPSHSKHDNITVLLSVHSPNSPVILPTTLPQNYRSLRRIRDESNHCAPAGADDNRTNDVCYFKKWVRFPKLILYFVLWQYANSVWARGKSQGVYMMDHFKAVTCDNTRSTPSDASHKLTNQPSAFPPESFVACGSVALIHFVQAKWWLS